MLPPALRLLMKLQMRARFRRMLGSAKTVKGVLYLVTMVGFLAMSIVPTLIFGFIGERSDPQTARSFLSIGLLGYCLMTLVFVGSESGVYFLPAEVDFLFAGPFRRRELLVYRLASFGLGCLVLALFFSAFLLKHVTYWIAAYVGTFLSLMFFLLLQTALQLAVSLIAEQAYTRLRRVVVGGVVAVVVAAVLLGLRHAGEGGWLAWIQQWQSSWVGTVVLAPFEVFSRTITAQSLVPEVAPWGALALLIDVAFAALILRLDADFTENSMKVSRKMYERVQRARSGGALASLVKSQDVRWRLPQLPWLRGAGPIAWRQLMTALRSTRGLAIMLGIVGVSSLTPLLFMFNGGQGNQLLPALISPLAMMSILFLPQMLQFDFRGDLDRLDVLKSLPISIPAIVFGQLIAPILMASMIQASILGGLAVGLESLRPWFLPVLIMLPVVNLLVMGIENLVFLLYPTRMAAAGGADPQLVGRQMLMMFLKMSALGAAAGLAAAIGGLAWWLSGESLVAAFMAAALVVLALGVALVPCIGLAFRRFDPSVDTPT